MANMSIGLWLTVRERICYCLSGYQASGANYDSFDVHFAYPFTGCFAFLLSS